MNSEKRAFYLKLSAAVVFMFVSPILFHVTEVCLGMNSSMMPFLSLGSVLFSMGMACKLVIDREGGRKSRRERKIKTK